MVNTKIVSRHAGSLPQGEDRRIPGGPLYPVHEVLDLLESDGSSLITWTKDCSKDVQSLALDQQDLIELVKLAVVKGHFKGAQWCMQKPGGPWAACDAYTTHRKEWIPAARKELDIEYYIKFAIGKTGTVLLLVSCHQS